MTQGLLVKSLTFPWQLSKSPTFSCVPGKWSPCKLWSNSCDICYIPCWWLETETDIMVIMTDWVNAITEQCHNTLWVIKRPTILFIHNFGKCSTFSKFNHLRTQHEICNKTHVLFPTTRQLYVAEKMTMILYRLTFGKVMMNEKYHWSFFDSQCRRRRRRSRRAQAKASMPASYKHFTIH